MRVLLNASPGDISGQGDCRGVSPGFLLHASGRYSGARRLLQIFAGFRRMFGHKRGCTCGFDRSSARFWARGHYLNLFDPPTLFSRSSVSMGMGCQWSNTLGKQQTSTPPLPSPFPVVISQLFGNLVCAVRFLAVMLRESLRPLDRTGTPRLLRGVIYVRK